MNIRGLGSDVMALDDDFDVCIIVNSWTSYAYDDHAKTFSKSAIEGAIAVRVYAVVVHFKVQKSPANNSLS